jgi:hypothetical protein
MSNRAIMSIVARGLMEPAFLEQLAVEPLNTLAAYGLDQRLLTEFGYLDIARLRNFGGLISKVQHNYLWESFPATQRLLCHYDLEIRLFADYRLFIQENPEAQTASRHLKIARFVQFVEDQLSRSDPARYPGLADVLKHEKLSWEVSKSPWAAVTRTTRSDHPDLTAVRAAEFGRLIPRLQGRLSVSDFEYDPLQIITQLAREQFDPNGLSIRGRVLAYWIRTPDAPLQVIEFDPGTIAILSSIDGRRSIRTIVRRITGASHVSRFVPFFEAASKHGLFTFASMD